MTYVTCPTMRYHPAVVAQKAATLQLLADGRFTLGLGSGENLNEHVVGEGWPGGAATRQDMLVEAIEIIRELHTGELSTTAASYFDVDSAAHLGPARAARCRSRSRCPASSPIEAVRPAGRPPDRRRARAPTSSTAWNAADGARRSATGRAPIGQIPICWDPDADARRATRARAVPLVRRRLDGQRRPADAGRASPARDQFVRPEDVADVDPVRARPRRDRRGGARRTGRPGSPTSRSCRSATSASSSSSTRRPGRCSRSCAQRPSWTAAADTSP